MPVAAVNGLANVYRVAACRLDPFAATTRSRASARTGDVAIVAATRSRRASIDAGSPGQVAATIRENAGERKKGPSGLVRLRCRIS